MEWHRKLGDIPGSVEVFVTESDLPCIGGHHSDGVIAVKDPCDVFKTLTMFVMPTEAPAWDHLRNGRTTAQPTRQGPAVFMIAAPLRIDHSCGKSRVVNHGDGKFRR